MQIAEKTHEIQPAEISKLLKKHYASVMSSFYETQSIFLSGIYKRYSSIETAHIILCFARNAHLTIIRQRENNLNYNVSLENFWNNLQNISKPIEKIAAIVQITSIPRETVRRKIKNLVDLGFLTKQRNTKGYVWNVQSKHKDFYIKSINEEVKILSKFTSNFANYLKLDLDIQLIEKELKKQFSFYWYHFLSCQLQWLKMWQNRLKDNDLLLIVLQAVIPTLQNTDKNLDNVFKVVGKANNNNFSGIAVSATAVAEITGIPRTTCIRKLEKLIILGFLLREKTTKRYFINQCAENRTTNILTGDSVNSTIENFSSYLSIVLNNLMNNKK